MLFCLTSDWVQFNWKSREKSGRNAIADFQVVLSRKKNGLKIIEFACSNFDWMLGPMLPLTHLAPDLTVAKAIN